MMAVDMAQGQGIPAVQPYNIILTGSFGVGKTSLFSKLSGEAHEDYQFVSVPVATSAQHVSKWTHTAAVNGDTVKVTLWDTGNLERTGLRNVTRSYFRHVVGVVLVYDIGNRDTLDKLYEWVSCVKDNVNWQWENSITYVVWGNNRDQTLTAVSEEQVQSFCGHLGLRPEDCCTVNAYTGHNVCESYQSLVERIHTQLSSLHTPHLHISHETPDRGETDASGCSC